MVAFCSYLWVGHEKIDREDIYTELKIGGTKVLLFLTFSLAKEKKKVRGWFHHLLSCVTGKLSTLAGSLKLVYSALKE